MRPAAFLLTGQTLSGGLSGGCHSALGETTDIPDKGQRFQANTVQTAHSSYNTTATCYSTRPPVLPKKKDPLRQRFLFLPWNPHTLFWSSGFGCKVQNELPWAIAFPFLTTIFFPPSPVFPSPSSHPDWILAQLQANALAAMLALPL